MHSLKSKFRVAFLIIIAAWFGVVAFYSLIKPVTNGCIMTYMYPTYIPISPSEGPQSTKYGLYLYHEGWKKIDFNEHLKKLSGVPVLFIPGNGGSYKQVRSLAAESDRAYQGGPLEHTFYQEASLNPEEGGMGHDLGNFQLPNQYTHRLDWFAVDLEGEHSAMDSSILEEHTEYVVHAIHRVLDQYKESYDAQAREGAASSKTSPKSVILVGHSMGGFVARAATIHPDLRKSSVETVITLSSPHQSPPLALQPALGCYFTRINQEWRKGYEVQTTRSGHHKSNPSLFHVVVVSVSGGYNDYQVRTKLESLDGIVPPTHGFLISSTAMRNVWLSMEHQAILWCNQLVIQVSHTLLSLIDSSTGQPYLDAQKRLAIFRRMLHSAVPQTFYWEMKSHTSQNAAHDSRQDAEDSAGSLVHPRVACPKNVHWSDDGLERDLYIETTTVTVLAMDGRRRWLDLQKLGSDGKSHFIFVTNLLPCSGVRLHLWPEKGKSDLGLPSSERVIEVTSKMVHIPSGPAPRQIEPGSQTEQAPPSAIFLLGPADIGGFRYLTISVAPRPTVSGRPPPAASMAVGQFFNPEEGKIDFSSWSMLSSSIYSNEDTYLKEDHPLAMNLSFATSLGVLPITLSLETTSCGIKSSVLPHNEAGDIDNSKLCKLRCFPPVAIAWDETSGLHIFPNLYSDTIVVDSSPSHWSSRKVSEKTTVLLLVDPHCAYKTSVVASLTASAGRFLLLYSAQIVGFSIAVVFFALMRQAHAWNLDLPVPSMLTAVESNLRLPTPFFHLTIAPILLSLCLSMLVSQSSPPFASFTIVSVICYLFANGVIVTLTLASQVVFYIAAAVHVFIRTRWQSPEGNVFLTNISSQIFSLKVVRALSVNISTVTAVSAITLVSFVHPALGLFVLLLSHALCCHRALSSFWMTSFRSSARMKELLDDRKEDNRGPQQSTSQPNGILKGSKDLKEDSHSSCPVSSKSYGETQLEIFHHRHGLLILHLTAALMFAPSLVAWFQRIGMSQSFPSFLDSSLCIGVILHGFCNSKPEFNSYIFSFLGIYREIRLDFIYLAAGYYSFLAGLDMAPFRLFNAMATTGFISFALRILQRRNRVKVGSRKHPHRH